MKTLYLLRHAKSSWKDDALADFDRPLNPRGKRATRTLADLFTKKKIKPDVIISSPAVRARETIERILRFTKSKSEPRFDERIYEAPAERLETVLTRIEKTAESALLVGHNPGMEELLTRLTGRSERMPTGALAKITFKKGTWSSIEAERGKLEWVARPKNLETDLI